MYKILLISLISLFTGANLFAQCEDNNDCKFGRICVNGECVDSSLQIQSTQEESETVTPQPAQVEPETEQPQSTPVQKEVDNSQSTPTKPKRDKKLGVFQTNIVIGYNLVQSVYGYSNEYKYETGPGFSVCFDGVFHPFTRLGGIAAHIGLGGGFEYTFPIATDDLGWVGHPDADSDKGSIQWIALYFTPQMMIPFGDIVGLRILFNFGGNFFLPSSAVKYPPYNYWDDDVDGGFHMKIGAGIKVKPFVFDFAWKKYKGSMSCTYRQMGNLWYMDDEVNMNVLSITFGFALRRRK